MTSPSSLFACPAADVTLERLRQLVDQGLPEGLTLEYKEAFTPSLVKSVAAMANTYGGIILVGVKDEPGTNRLSGVGEDAIIQIVNACHDSLEPPWEPEVIPVPLDDADRLVLVVRVDPVRAPRPILHEKVVPVRLQGRNAIADRNRLVTLFSEATTMTSRNQQVLIAPQLPMRADGQPDADLVLRSGFWLPLGEAAGWRPLSDRGVDRLKEALNHSALGSMLIGWAGQLGIRGLNTFDRRGFNRSRRARLVWQAVIDGPVEHPVEAITELQLPEPLGTAATSMCITVDVVMRVRSTLQGVGVPTVSPWRMAVPDLYKTIDGLVAGLVDDKVVGALADIADIDPTIVSQPVSAHLITVPAVDGLLYLQGLVPIEGSGSSHGAYLLADPALDLAVLDDRRAQVDAWMQQIALDSGLRGMERLLDEIHKASRPQ